MRTIDRLVEKFPPPVGIVEAGVEERWPVVQERLGSVLPRDYKDFINRYGSVYVDKFLRITNPFSERPFVNFYHYMAQSLSALRVLKAEHGARYCPYALWFEPSGLLPWACTDNGDVLFWLTAGHPDQWTVVVNDTGTKFLRFDGGMAEFLLAFLDRSLDGTFFDEVFDEPRPAALLQPLPKS